MYRVAILTKGESITILPETPHFDEDLLAMELTNWRLDYLGQRNGEIISGRKQQTDEPEKLVS